MHDQYVCKTPSKNKNAGNHISLYELREYVVQKGATPAKNAHQNVARSPGLKAQLSLKKKIVKSLLVSRGV
jgi:hypothetical protein